MPWVPAAHVFSFKRNQTNLFELVSISKQFQLVIKPELQGQFLFFIMFQSTASGKFTAKPFRVKIYSLSETLFKPDLPESLDVIIMVDPFYKQISDPLQVFDSPKIKNSMNNKLTVKFYSSPSNKFIYPVYFEGNSSF